MEDPLSPLNTSMQYTDHRLIEKERTEATLTPNIVAPTIMTTLLRVVASVLQWSANGAVTLNNIHQGLQTDAKWNTQQCCVGLHGA